jgi:hypothetical protein
MRFAFTLALLASALSLVWAEEPKERGWRELIHPHHRSSIDQALAHIDKVHAGLTKDAAGYSERDKVMTLVSSRSVPISENDLLGTWQVRSIQGGSLGIFPYPFFKGRFFLRNGELRFEKKTGSQFRFGRLFADGGPRLIFLGVQYVSGESPTGYSALVPDASGEDGRWDSVGVLVKKADGRLVMILDAKEDAYEIYEMVR